MINHYELYKPLNQRSTKVNLVTNIIIKYLLFFQVLNNMFFSNDSDNGSDASGTSLGRRDDRRLMSARVAQELTQNYEDLVKDLIMSEQQNIRELELIIKVFRPPFVELFPSSKVSG